MIITKDFLIERYYDDGLSQEQIADKCNCSRRWIGKLMKKYNIEINPYRKIESLVVNDYQKKIIIGSVLGDGSIVKNYNRYRLQIAHGFKQKKYLLWKKESLSDIMCDNIVNFHENEFLIYSHAHDYFKELRYAFYNNSGKIIRDIDYLNQMGDLGLAIWYMDDGTRGIGRTQRTLQISFATQSFDEKSNLKIKNWFYDRYKLKAKILKYINNNKETRRIYFSKDDSLKLIEIVKPFIHKSMLYKINTALEEPVENIRLTYFNNMMICSDLYGNMQSTSEMNVPPIGM